MEYFAGLDVAVEETSICVIDRQSYGDSTRAPRRRVLPMEEDSIRIIVDWSGS